MIGAAVTADEPRLILPLVLGRADYPTLDLAGRLPRDDESCPGQRVIARPCSSRLHFGVGRSAGSCRKSLASVAASAPRRSRAAAGGPCPPRALSSGKQRLGKGTNGQMTGLLIAPTWHSRPRNIRDSGGAGDGNRTRTISLEDCRAAGARRTSKMGSRCRARRVAGRNPSR